MTPQVPEADWKLFRKLREAGLEQFCARVLDEVDSVRRDDSRSHRERHGAIFALLRKRDRELARAFDAPRRSQMIWQLAAMVALDLVPPEELARFTPETRSLVEQLTQLRRRK
jgi:ERCC4-related helicase